MVRGAKIHAEKKEAAAGQEQDGHASRQTRSRNVRTTGSGHGRMNGNSSKGFPGLSDRTRIWQLWYWKSSRSISRDARKGTISMTKNIERVLGAMYGVAVGDALGGPVEFMDADAIARQYGILDTMVGGGWLSLSPGETTDDTAMTLAVAKGIMANPDRPVGPSARTLSSGRRVARKTSAERAAAPSRAPASS